LIRLFAVALIATVAGSAAAQNTNEPPKSTGGKTNWEIENERNLVVKESEVHLPALPASGSLVEFYVSAGASFRFFIDAPSLSVGKDGVVRYTLVARSPSGVDNVSFEGMHCVTGRYRVYAVGGGEKWTPVNSDWKDVEAKTVQRWHQALRREYFCAYDIPVGSVDEALRYLRTGGHPDFKRTR
jgi:hypothetical protein